MAIETKESPTTLNAMLNLFDENHQIQFDKDKEAARQFFLQDINKNTVYFNSLEEKVDYLVENNYWDKATINKYDMSFIKQLFKDLYNYKHRFRTYLGALKFYNQYALKTREGDRYLERWEDRCAIVGLYLGDGDENLASNIAESIMRGQFQPATPTFQNSGKTARGGLTSCFLLDMQDNIESIMRTLNSAAVLSKNGGGIGVNFTNLRETGAPIKDIDGLSSGIVPSMKMFEDTVCRYFNQLGTRQGSMVANLNIFHPDIEVFLDTKKENADEGIRMRLLSIAVLIPDVFMQEAAKNHDVPLFSPYEIKKEYGVDMSSFDITANYHELLDNPNISKKKKINARKLLARIAEVQSESGYPYMIFIDNANNQKAVDGRIKMSNLCVVGDSEILTENGYRNVKDLYQTQEDITVMVDNRVLNKSKIETGVSPRKSTKMLKTADQAPVFTLRTKEGYNLTATGYHKFYMIDKYGELVKKELLDLCVGDKVLIQSGEGFSKTNDSKDDGLAYLMGIIAGDGTFDQYTLSNGIDKGYSVKIYLYDEKQEVEQQVLQCVNNVLRDKQEILNKRSTTTPLFSIHKNRKTLSSAPLSVVLAENGFTKETKHKINNYIRNGSKDTQVKYLSGLYQMDGSLTGSKLAKNISLELVQADRELLEDVQILLVNLGIYSRLYKAKTKRTEILPDGKGGYKEYNVRDTWCLKITNRKDILKVMEVLDLRPSQIDKFNKIASNFSSKKPYNTHKHLATISSIEYAGIEPVYDVTVDDPSHSLIFNGIVTGNCSEIFQPQTPSILNEDYTYRQVGMDVACNLGSLIIDGVMDSGKPEEIISTAIRALTKVADTLEEPGAPTVEMGNHKARSIGLSAMNLHGYLARESIHYGSEEALDFVSAFFAMVRFYSLKESNKIATERWQTFEGFTKSKYATGEFFDKYIQNDFTPKTDKVSELFSKADIKLPTQKDWEDLKVSVMESGLYHRELMAQPPTGSISYVQSSTPGLMPIPAIIETRKESMVGRVYYPQPYMTNDNLEFYGDAYELGYKKIIDTFAASQQHIDQGQSMNLYFNKNEANTRTINKAQIYAWKMGLKSTYYVRFQQEALTGTEVEDCVSCSI